MEENIISISENRNASSLVTAHLKLKLSLELDPCELGDVVKRCLVTVIPFALRICRAVANETKQNFIWQLLIHSPLSFYFIQVTGCLAEASKPHKYCQR